MISKRDHICVCICTYKRPEMLRRLLTKLEDQETEGLFSFSVVIADNDRSESAREVVEAYAEQGKITIRYDVEPEQNISLARNKALENSRGDYIAFIDDDEFPVWNWLLALYKALICFESDGVLGPVFPWFGVEPPRWILKGRFFERPIHRTGIAMEWRNTRTGNALLRRDLFNEKKEWFDPRFGFGGEDRDFFKRKLKEGHRFVWCNEAPVFETIPPGRWKGKNLLKRALVRGRMTFLAERSEPLSIPKAVFGSMCYSFLIPFSLALGYGTFMKYLIRNCDHIGKILAACRIDVIKVKYIVD